MRNSHLLLLIDGYCSAIKAKIPVERLEASMLDGPFRRYAYEKAHNGKCCGVFAYFYPSQWEEHRWKEGGREHPHYSSRARQPSCLFPTAASNEEEEETGG